MLPITDIARAVRASRTEFANLFQQAQVGLPGGSRTAFEAVARSAVDTDAFAEALAFAQLQGFLEPLIDAIIDARLEDGNLAQAAAEDAAGTTDGAARLQAMANAVAGFLTPDIFYRGIADGMRWTTKILVDGIARGTGVLIAPNFVLTAWHVVRELFQVVAGGSPQPIAGAGNRLQIQFDDFLALVDRGRALRPVGSRRVQAHADPWCQVFSACHPDELDDHLPNDLTSLDGHWDYAVIRLAEALGLERRWSPLDARAVVPKAEERVLIFQHPVGQPMRFDQALIASAAADQRDAIPRYRFLHSVNALPGSSGGPCFDKSFMLFGLHQGAWANGANGERAINRGIPIVRILEHIRKQIQELPALDPSESPVWRLDQRRGFAPVIGCDDFQAMVWRSAVGGLPKIVAITGADKGIGKTFRVSVLEQMLPDESHLKVRLRAEAIAKMDARQLAAVICSTAGAAAPEIAEPAAINSTSAVWLKDEVTQKVVAALEQARINRLVWIAITDLDLFAIEGSQASDLLLLLYEQALKLSWLRIVLDGMRGAVPASILEALERHTPQMITEEQIRTYLDRFVAQLELPVEAYGMRTATRLLFGKYNTAYNSDPETAAARLAAEATQLGLACMEAA